jgi:hypothetical protein
VSVPLVTTSPATSGSVLKIHQPRGERQPLIERQLAARQVREPLEPGPGVDPRHDRTSFPP